MMLGAALDTQLKAHFLPIFVTTQSELFELYPSLAYCNEGAHIHSDWLQIKDVGGFCLWLGCLCDDIKRSKYNRNIGACTQWTAVVIPVVQKCPESFNLKKQFLNQASNFKFMRFWILPDSLVTFSSHIKAFADKSWAVPCMSNESVKNCSQRYQSTVTTNKKRRVSFDGRCFGSIRAWFLFMTILGSEIFVITHRFGLWSLWGIPRFGLVSMKA